LSPVRAQFDYEAIRHSDQTLLATAYSVHVSIDRQGRVVKLPERVRELLL
jgi:acyl-CoA thioesterase FadM